MRGVVERPKIDTELRCELRERPTLADRCPLKEERDNLVVLLTKVSEPRIDEGERDGRIVERVDANVELTPQWTVRPVMSVTMQQRDAAVDGAVRDVPVGVLSVTGIRIVRGQHTNPQSRTLDNLGQDCPARLLVERLEALDRDARLRCRRYPIMVARDEELPAVQRGGQWNRLSDQSEGDVA